MSDTTSPVSPAAPTGSEAAGADLPRASRYALGHPRLWPAVAIVVLEWLLVTVPGRLAPGTMTQFLGMFYGPLLGTVALAAWWLFGSRVPWRDRGLGLVACGAVGAAMVALSHPSFGLMALVVYAFPVVATAAVLWLIATPS